MELHSRPVARSGKQRGVRIFEVAAEDCVGDDPEYTASNAIKNRIGNPPDAEQSDVSLNAPECRRYYCGTATLPAHCLISEYWTTKRITEPFSSPGASHIINGPLGAKKERLRQLPPDLRSAAG